ncbi:hypothetical protein CYY_002231 [Polysphondylium violaceum]|uniref:1-phosphatidylinositol-3-phosphate 5-kinase n=1 Tax=Polysphondylium violaceum TaxID=133409 RepID=A0A8J4PYT8_9MYCE|nr:hypothetical protein CYY_002231 [Polysphondylium violaceum]
MSGNTFQSFNSSSSLQGGTSSFFSKFFGGDDSQKDFGPLPEIEYEDRLNSTNFNNTYFNNNNTNAPSSISSSANTTVGNSTTSSPILVNSSNNSSIGLNITNKNESPKIIAKDDMSSLDKISSNSNNSSGGNNTGGINHKLIDAFKAKFQKPLPTAEKDKRFWVPDHSSFKCYDCSAEFTTFKRKHHCRLCGQIFCWKCSEKTLTDNKGQQIRVCNFCYTFYTTPDEDPLEITNHHQGTASGGGNQGIDGGIVSGGLDISNHITTESLLGNNSSHNNPLSKSFDSYSYSDGPLSSTLSSMTTTTTSTTTNASDSTSTSTTTITTTTTGSNSSGGNAGLFGKGFLLNPSTILSPFKSKDHHQQQQQQYNQQQQQQDHQLVHPSSPPQSSHHGAIIDDAMIYYSDQEVNYELDDTASDSSEEEQPNLSTSSLHEVVDSKLSSSSSDILFLHKPASFDEHFPHNNSSGSSSNNTNDNSNNNSSNNNNNNNLNVSNRYTMPARGNITSFSMSALPSIFKKSTPQHGSTSPPHAVTTPNGGVLYPPLTPNQLSTTPQSVPLLSPSPLSPTQTSTTSISPNPLKSSMPILSFDTNNNNSNLSASTTSLIKNRHHENKQQPLVITPSSLFFSDPSIGSLQSHPKTTNKGKFLEQYPLPKKYYESNDNHIDTFTHQELLHQQQYATISNHTASALLSKKDQYIMEQIQKTKQKELELMEKQVKFQMEGEPLVTPYIEHIYGIVVKQLCVNGIDPEWNDIILKFAKKACTNVKIYAKNGDRMSPNEYIKVKKIPGGSKSECNYIDGVVMTKILTHKKMKDRFVNPKILLLSCSVEFQRVENKFLFFDQLLQQEKEYLRILVSKIAERKPDIVLVEKTVSRHAQDFLLDAGISLALNVKPKVLERLGRCLGGEVLPTLDIIYPSNSLSPTGNNNLASPSSTLNAQPSPASSVPSSPNVNSSTPNNNTTASNTIKNLGSCGQFRIQTYSSTGLKDDGVLAKKTLMYFEKCPAELGATITIRGESLETLKIIKKILVFTIYAIRHSMLEVRYLRDQSSTTTFYSSIHNDQKLSCSPQIRFTIPKSYPSIPWKYRFTSQHIPSRKFLLQSFYRPHSDSTGQQQSVIQYQTEDEILGIGTSDAFRKSRFPPLENESIFDHQSIAFSHSIFCNSNQCIPFETHSIDYYTDNDLTLGEFLNKFCFSNYVCNIKECNRPLIEHERTFMNSTCRINICVQKTQTIQDKPSKIRTGPPPPQRANINVINLCKVCNKFGPEAQLSAEAWEMSFGKFLEISFFGFLPISLGITPECTHYASKDHISYFYYKDLAAIFSYELLPTLDLCLPSPKAPVIDPVQKKATRFKELELLDQCANQVYSALNDKLMELGQDNNDRVGELIPSLIEEKRLIISKIAALQLDVPNTSEPIINLTKILYANFMTWNSQMSGISNSTNYQRSKRNLTTSFDPDSPNSIDLSKSRIKQHHLSTSTPPITPTPSQLDFSSVCSDNQLDALSDTASTTTTYSTIIDRQLASPSPPPPPTPPPQIILVPSDDVYGGNNSESNHEISSTTLPLPQQSMNYASMNNVTNPGGSSNPNITVTASGGSNNNSMNYNNNNNGGSTNNYSLNYNQQSLNYSNMSSTNYSNPSSGNSSMSSTNYSPNQTTKDPSKPPGSSKPLKLIDTIAGIVSSISTSKLLTPTVPYLLLDSSDNIALFENEPSTTIAYTLSSADFKSTLNTLIQEELNKPNLLSTDNNNYNSNSNNNNNNNNHNNNNNNTSSKETETTKENSTSVTENIPLSSSGSITIPTSSVPIPSSPSVEIKSSQVKNISGSSPSIVGLGSLKQRTTLTMSNSPILSPTLNITKKTSPLSSSPLGTISKSTDEFVNHDNESLSSAFKKNNSNSVEEPLTSEANDILENKDQERKDENNENEQELDEYLTLDNNQQQQQQQQEQDYDIFSEENLRLSRLIVANQRKEIRSRFKFEKNGNEINIFCTTYYPVQFHALREFVCGDNEFIESLSRSKIWNAKGGKSGSSWTKTLDDRFILKQVSRIELESFLDFAPLYFEYICKAFLHQIPTTLCKTLGVYSVRWKDGNGKSIKKDLIVMENLFYNKNISKTYDLKGSLRGRLVKNESEVLLDENLLQASFASPICLPEYDKTRIALAVWNDTAFLSSLNVMDYSLLTGIDSNKNQLVVGIIDYMRKFTWDKALEMKVKQSGIMGGGGKVPTVISPKQYKLRFRDAMWLYFTMVPDKFTKVKHLENNNNQKKKSSTTNNNTNSGSGNSQQPQQKV